MGGSSTSPRLWGDGKCQSGELFSLQGSGDGFTKTVRAANMRAAVTVNAVAPGFIDTAMTQGLPPEVKDALQKQIPLGRLASSDIAAGSRFLYLMPRRTSRDRCCTNGGMPWQVAAGSPDRSGLDVPADCGG